MANTVIVNKDTILDILNAADSYGYGHAIVLDALVRWHGPISEAEIKTFSETFLEEEGYGEEDVEAAADNIYKIFRMYGRVIRD